MIKRDELSAYLFDTLYAEPRTISIRHYTKI